MIWIFNVIINTNPLSLIIGRGCFPLNYVSELVCRGKGQFQSLLKVLCYGFCSSNWNTLRMIFFSSSEVNSKNSIVFYSDCYVPKP